MPSRNRRNRPLIADLGALLKALTEAGIEFIVVGGLAAVAQGAPITTMDIDIVHRQSKENIEKLLALLKKVDAVYRRPDDTIIEPEAQDLWGRGHVLFVTRYGPLDVLAVIEEDRGYDDLLPDTIEIEYRGYKVRMLNLKALVELKKSSQNPKERQRLPVLLETLRQTSEKGSTDL